MIQKFHFWGYTQKKSKTGTQIDIHAFVLVTALFTIAKSWIYPKCSSMDKQINKCGIYTIKYCSALKREILTSAAIWINLEDIMLNK